MKKTSIRPVALVLLSILWVTGILFCAACGQRDTSSLSTFSAADGDILGSGAKSFTLSIVDADGAEITVTVRTDEEFLGTALQACGLIDGEEGPYGLYIKTVNGILADYDTDGTYWAFYEHGELALTGVDTTVVLDGGEYALRVEK